MENRPTTAQWGQKPTYEEWQEKQGIPVYRDKHGIEDITLLPRRPWARTGGLGTFIELDSTRDCRKEMYVAEIPPGKALEPERHLYDELLYVLEGRGLAEVWHEGKPKVSFEWGEGSLFAIPLNAWHRLVNGSQNRVLIFAQSSAPIIMNVLRNAEFVFNCSYNFGDRFQGQGDYFTAGKAGLYKRPGGNAWDTNFVPDMRKALMGDWPEKVEGGLGSAFNMAAWTGAGVSEWPVGRYHKAHFHGPGAILLGMNSEGYVLLWPYTLGIHPYQDGHGDKVVKQPWKKNSIYSPQSGWYHHHFNTGKLPAAHFRTTGGGIGIGLPSLEQIPMGVSVRQGGRLIEHEDEDPEIRRQFAATLRAKGIEIAMKPVVYNTKPIKLAWTA